MRYNYAIFSTPDPVAVNLLDLRFEIAPTHAVVGPRLRRVVTARPWTLYERRDAPGRATVVTSWRNVGAPAGALDAVSAAGFDPGAEVVVEQRPVFPGPRAGAIPAHARVRYAQTSDQSARVLVDARAPSVVLIRTPYAPGWHATVDGRPADVIPADYVDQAVAVSAGHHVITLEYREPTIAIGSAVTAAAVLLLIGGAGVGVLGNRRRRRAGEDRAGPVDAIARRPPSAPAPPDPDTTGPSG
jgi:hypothetical protein